MEIGFPKIEEKILRFWKKNKIFEKSILQRKKAKNFVFYDGPITVNALPGIHHALSRIFKDIIPRFKTMRGFRVERKNGWDTHGLPVELEVEKELGFKTKKDIKKYGIAGFNRACKKNVQKYIPLFKDFTEKIGYWVDMEDPYITYETDYIETIWWIIKQIYKKGLLYKDYKVVPYCPRCGTSLSSHEVALGYKKIKEPALYVKLPVKNQKNTYLLIWTTTPWTLPGNVAIAVNPNFTYIKARVGREDLILAKGRLKVLGRDYKILRKIKGKELLNLQYKPLFRFIKPEKKAYFVIAGGFVSLEEGTGLVHIAPAFGVEDMIVGKENNLPILLTVDEEGKFKPEVKKWAGMFVKDADPEISEDLKKRNLVFKEEQYEHDYPFCWRCKSPLLYYAKESWFINMQKIKKDLIKNNQKINWIPAHIKKGRFGEWLKEVKDWALSRERYWGTPLPIWQCKRCGNLEVISSKKDLISQKFSENKYFILRHGETFHQTKKKGIIYDWPGFSSYPLTKKGKKEIESLAKKLRKGEIDLIYSSDSLRARQTAKIVAKELGLKINFSSKLRDMNFGIYQGCKIEEFYKIFIDIKERFYKRPKNGESWSDCRKRMISLIKKIDRRHKGKTILIISHGDPLWLLEGILKGLSNENLIRQKLQGKIIETGELRKIKFSSVPLNEKGELDFHRPYIDEVKFFCPKCRGLMKRVLEVIDCWFDAGSMPLAQYHYPFENKKLIDQKKQFPADYIAEAIDQTRGWFYTLLAISTLLGLGPSYKNVISLGLVLDEKGEKMSKSKGNMVDPWQIFKKYGSDTLRWYFFTVNQPGEAKCFSEREIQDSLKRFIMTFWNCSVFFNTYGGLRFSRSWELWSRRSRNVLDRWAILRLNELIQVVTKNLEDFDVTSAARNIEKFVIEDFSQWYIRRSRKRFHHPEKKEELKEASATLGYLLLTLTKLTAPFIPFLSEEIYQKIKSMPRTETKFLVRDQKSSKESLRLPMGQAKLQSVHLSDWPKGDKRLIDKTLNKKMDQVRKIVSLGLRSRMRAKIKVRQPLTKLKIQKPKLKIDKKLLNLIKEELNIREIKIVRNIKKEKNWILESEGKIKIALNIKISPKLREKGMVREVIRNLQEMRKKAGLKPKDRILVYFLGYPNLNKILVENKDFILKKTKAKGLQFGKKSKLTFDIEENPKINREKLWLAIKKLK